MKISNVLFQELVVTFVDSPLLIYAPPQLPTDTVTQKEL